MKVEALHLPEHNVGIFSRRPSSSWGDSLTLLDQGLVKDPKALLDYFSLFNPSRPGLDGVVLVTPTSSSVVRRNALSRHLRGCSLDRLERLAPAEWEQGIDYDGSLLEKQRVTTEMPILTLVASLLGLSEGRFPVTYFSAFSEGVLGRFLMKCYPIYESPGGDIVLRYGLRPDEIRKRIFELNPRIVGINCLTSSHHNDCLDIARIVRSINPDIKIIVGGVHPSALDKYFAQHPCVDYVCVGEGDVTLPELIYRLFNDLGTHDVRGITFREGDRIVRNPPRPVIHPDLAPWFLREAIPQLDGVDVVTLYGLWNNGELVGKSTTVQGSRGCGLGCNYCASGQQRFRRRSVENQLAELQYLASQGYEAISDESDQVVLPVLLFKQLCKGIINRGLNKRLTFHTPNGLLVDGLWKLGEEGRRLMVEAGYRDLCLAVEGSKEYVEKILKRRIDVDLVPRICESFRRIAKELGVELTIRVFTQPGAPGETREMRQDIIRLATEWVDLGYVDHVISFVSTPIAGTSFFERTEAVLFEQAQEDRWILRLGGLIPDEAIRDLPCVSETQIYKLFEQHHIWTRCRFGLANLSPLFGSSSEENVATARALESLTPGQLKWY